MSHAVFLYPSLARSLSSERLSNLVVHLVCQLVQHRAIFLGGTIRVSSDDESGRAIA